MFNVHEITQSEITWSLIKKAAVRKLEEQAERRLAGPYVGACILLSLLPYHSGNLHTAHLSEGEPHTEMEPKLGKREIKLYGRH